MARATFALSFFSSARKLAAIIGNIHTARHSERVGASISFPFFAHILPMFTSAAQMSASASGSHTPIVRAPSSSAAAAKVSLLPLRLARAAR